ncbi:MAG TPA: DoxX family protein [Candidatus Saccharimonadales bacterium]|nr:DoxX family protein [Candidatus Saccharimonadales bacterium]
MRTLIRTACRFLLAGIFVYSGYGMITHTDRYAKQASAAFPMLPEDPRLPKVLGAIMIGGGSTLALGILPKTSARLLALTLIPSTIVGHPFWKAEKPEDRRAQMIQVLKNAGLFGGLLYIATDRRTKPQPED